MKVNVNQRTGIKEIIYPGKLISIGKTIQIARNFTEYRICRVEVTYPNGKVSIVGSKLWEKMREILPHWFEPGIFVDLIIPIEGEFAETSTIKSKVLDYEDLVRLKNKKDITYIELLHTREWKLKRDEIINRDSNRCKICNHSASEVYDKDEAPIQYISKRFDDFFFEDKNETKRFIVPMQIIEDFPRHLNVHHNYYIYNKLPWEYDDALITVCNICHDKIHSEEIIKLYYSNDFLCHENLTPCSRCNGTGWFPEYEYIQNGICFECRGNRFTTSVIN